ncbi:hypothetical protein IWW37_005634 [Coemansia sp. RSA 2050]|nr:hypothetical protein IWW37_005634 [Coemansia sp. RSA 2050]
MDSRRKTTGGVDSAGIRAPRPVIWSQTFGEAKSEGDGQLSPGQRTLSWVSSAFSATESLTVANVSVSGGSKGQIADCEPGSDATGGADDIDSTSASLTRRQHVRLTTIDPITGSIAFPSSTASVNEHYNPGHIEEVFISPRISHVKIPRPGDVESISSPCISELSVDSSIGYLDGRIEAGHDTSLEADDNDEPCCLGQAHEAAQLPLLVQPHFATDDCETRPASAIAKKVATDQGKGTSNSELEGHVDSRRAAPRVLLRNDQRLVERESNSTKRTSRAILPR